MKFFKEKSLYILQVTAVIMVISSFIPFCNPFRVGQVANTSLVTMLWNTDEVVKYFVEQIGNALTLNSTFFWVTLISIISLLFILMTTVLTFRHAGSGRTAIKIGLFFGIVLCCSTFFLFLDFADLNTQILTAHTGKIYRKIHIFTKIPFGVYFYFCLSVIYTLSAYFAYDFDLFAIWFNVQSHFANRFKGGIHPPYNKFTKASPIETVEPDKLMIYPLVQHIGDPCNPIVKVGDYVKIGQKIAESDSPVSAPVHTTVSGTVKKIEQYLHPTLNETMAIVIENDFLDQLDPSLINVQRDYTSLTPEEIIGYVKEAGIVGMGGAAFPTYIKLQSALNQVDTLLINAAECEPYLTSDHRVMLENTAEFVEGIKIIRQALGVQRVYVGVESNKPDAISRLYSALRRTRIKIVVLATKYPQGGEKQLIKSITRREVPSGKLPVDVGCCVFNVDTAVAIYRAVVKGYPLMRRIVTIAGNGIEKRGNANVRIGTPISSVLQKYGLKGETQKIIMGGPMMGNSICHLDAPIVKNTSGLLCLTEEQLADDYDGNNCIRCGRCISVCPMKLAPNYIGLYTDNGDFGKCAQLGVLDCIECGCCSYTCPAKLPLLQYIRIAKQKIKENSAKS